MGGALWTPSAIDCFEINSDCHNCVIYKLFPDLNCQMAHTVNSLLELVGPPGVHNLVSKGQQKDMKSHLAVLRMIRRKPGCTSVDIMLENHMEKEKVHHSIRFWYEKGIIDKKPGHIGGRRINSLFITEKEVKKCSSF